MILRPFSARSIMVILTGKASILRNVLSIVLASSKNEKNAILTWEDLSHEYRKFLNLYALMECDESSCQPAFCSSPERLKKLKKRFEGYEILDDLGQGSVISSGNSFAPSIIHEKLMCGLVYLKDKSPDHYDLFNLVISDFIVAPSERARAGSTSSAPGCVWIADIERYQSWEVAEILVHELVHNLVFLDELVKSHYDYELITKKENYATSSILKVLRPVDKVLHSIIVATEILLYRERIGSTKITHRVHPPTPLLIEQLENSLQSMRILLSRKPAVLTARGRELFEFCSENCARFLDDSSD